MKKRKEIIMQSMNKLVFLVISVLIFVTCLPAPAQYKLEPLEDRVFFESMEACKAAYAKGPQHFRYYEPDPKYLRTPRSSAKGLSADSCVQEDVRKNESKIDKPHVILALGTRVTYGPNGKPIADDRCWNKIHASEELAPRKGEKGDPGPPGTPGARGVDGSPGKNGEPGKNAEFPKPSKTQIGVTLSGMLGAFDSVALNNVVDVERLSGNREVCAQGRTFDLGLAFGGPDKSFWRITFAIKKFEEGSFTRRKCGNCTEVQVAATGDVRVLGLQIERVFRIPLHEKLPVQLMAAGHIGAGKITGTAYQYVGPVGGPPTSVTKVDAREIFGSEYFPIAGADVGVMGNIFDGELTWTATVAGIEWPGIYYGRISLTYWIK